MSKQEKVHSLTKKKKKCNRMKKAHLTSEVYPYHKKVSIQLLSQELAFQKICDRRQIILKETMHGSNKGIPVDFEWQTLPQGKAEAIPSFACLGSHNKCAPIYLCQPQTLKPEKQWW